MTRESGRRRFPKASRGALALLLAVLVGIGAVWLSIWDFYVFLNCDVFVIHVHPLALAVTIGPGVSGLLIITSCVLFAFGKRFGPLLYWLAVLAAAGVLMVMNYTYIGVDRTPGFVPTVRWTYPEEELGSLWWLTKVSVLWALIILGRWMPEQGNDGASIQPHATLTGASS